MKIALIQLARLGDILMMWPLISAMKRTYPGAEITMIVRENFKEALFSFEEIHCCILFPSRHLLEPVLSRPNAAEESQTRVRCFLQDLEAMEFDWIVNLTFSPLSADLTYFLSRTKEGECRRAVQTTGYTRFPDGSIRTTEDLGSYFLDQVGVDRHNRKHLSEIFAQMAHVLYEKSDFDLAVKCPPAAMEQNYFTLHLGASEQHKKISTSLMIKMLSCLLPQIEGQVVLIGASNEVSIADAILAAFSETKLEHRIINLAGKTKLKDLFGILKNARLHLGGDSLPVQIVQLTQTPALVLSFRGTNFFETGPLSEKSCVLRYSSQDEVFMSDIEDTFLKMWHKLEPIPIENLYRAIPSAVPVKFENSVNVYDLGFQPLLDFLYFDDLSFLESNIFLLGINSVKKGFQNLQEANLIVIEQMKNKLESPRQIETFQLIATQVDQVFKVSTSYHESLSLFVRWSETLKSQIPPGSFQEVFENSKAVYTKIQNKLDLICSMFSVEYFNASIKMDFEKEGQL